MWITKLKLQHKDCPIVTRCKKFHLIVFSYPSTWYEKKDHKFATTTCYFQSQDEVKKKKFLVDLKADKRITQLEAAGDTFTLTGMNIGKLPPGSAKNWKSLFLISKSIWMWRRF